LGAGPEGAETLKLLLDEMLDVEIAIQLRARGWDVDATQGDHPKLMGFDDEVVLERSTAMSRSLVTDNVRHFMPIHERWLGGHRSHCGLVFASAHSYPRRKDDVGLWVRGIEAVLASVGEATTENLCFWLP
jgi:Domain of unknown function (DUF5615)